MLSEAVMKQRPPEVSLLNTSSWDAAEKTAGLTVAPKSFSPIRISLSGV